MVDPDHPPSSALGLFLRIQTHAFDSGDALTHFYLLHDCLHCGVSAVKTRKNFHLDDTDELASR